MVKIQWPYWEVHVGKNWETKFKNKGHVQDHRNQAAEFGLHPIGQYSSTWLQLELTEEVFKKCRYPGSLPKIFI